MLLYAGAGRPQAPAYSVPLNVWNIAYCTTSTYSESSMRAALPTSGNTSTLIVPKAYGYGKWVLEFEVVDVGSGVTVPRLGIRKADGIAVTGTGFVSADGDYQYRSDGNKADFSGGAVAYGDTFTTNDFISVLFNGDTGEISFAKNGVDQGVAYSGLTSSYLPAASGASTGATSLRVSTTNTYSFSGYTQWR